MGCDRYNYVHSKESYDLVQYGHELDAIARAIDEELGPGSKAAADTRTIAEMLLASMARAEELATPELREVWRAFAETGYGPEERSGEAARYASGAGSEGSDAAVKIEVPNQDLLHALRAIMPMDLRIEKLTAGASTVWVTASRLGYPEVVVTAVYRGSALPLNGRGCAHVAPEDAPRVARLLVEELAAKAAAEHEVAALSLRPGGG